MSAPLPRPSKTGQTAMEIEPTLLAEPTEDDADSLVSSNEPDDLANEQTWPTEEEMRGNAQLGDPIPDAKKGTTPKAVRRLPKGTSEYQAAWIVDESDEEDGDGEGEGLEEADMDEMVEEEEMVDMPTRDDDDDMATDGRSVMFQDLDMEEEGRQYVILIFATCYVAKGVSEAPKVEKSEARGRRRQSIS